MIISFILMTSLTENALILQREIKRWSLLERKGLRANAWQGKTKTTAKSRFSDYIYDSVLRFAAAFGFSML